MRYILMILLILPVSVYSFSFAKYNWNQKNKIAAVGVVLITLMSIVMPIIAILYRRQFS